MFYNVRLSKSPSLLLFLSAALLTLSLVAGKAHAQVEVLDRKVIFREDAKIVKEEHKRLVKQASRDRRGGNSNLDFKAPDVQYDQEAGVVKGTGGVLLSYEGTQVQADSGSVKMDTKESELEGSVFFTTDAVSIGSKRATFNIEKETGEFEDVDLLFEEGGYHIDSQLLRKVSEFDFEVDNAKFSTCNCEDGAKPWALDAGHCDITQNGYAHCKSVTFDVHGVPIFYTPYLIVPVKTERASGLLAPKFGYSSEDGAAFSIPLFLALDGSSDFTVTPFIESRTRTGSLLQYQQVVSRRNKLKGRMLYSNESARDGNLRGTVTNDVFDPEIDENRFAGFYRQSWRSAPEGLIPASFQADLHYASDDLLVREIEDDEIGKSTTRYLTSTAALQGAFGPYLFGSVGGEFNQSINTDDDFVFQRLPDTSLTALKSFRPFGYNPLGAKLVSRTSLGYTEFARDEGYDGRRFEVRPTLRMPFHIQNYANAEIGAGIRQTYYGLNETFDPSSGTELDDSQSRTLPELNAAIGTGFERVFDVDRDGWFAQALSLGELNRNKKVVRLKHTVEPQLRFNYVPDTTQDDLPFFDSTDRIRERSLFTFAVRTALLGRYNSVNPVDESITELTPTVEDLPVLGLGENLADPLQGGIFEDPFLPDVSIRKGEIRELAALTVKQSYDYKEDKEDNDPERRPWSDLGARVELFPNQNLRFGFESNFDSRESQFSSWGLTSAITDDRGDALRARYTFIDNELGQLDGNVEMRVTDRVKLGYFTKFDESESEFIENVAAVRLKSACNCWTIDFSYHEKINPDKNQFFITFNLGGLGQIG